MKSVYDQIKDLIIASKTILIAGHIDPDGDTLGSMVALKIILEKLDKRAEMFSQDGVPENYRFLPRSSEIKNTTSLNEYDLLITVDASDLTRVGSLKAKAKKTINIDHHADNSNFGDINCVELLSSVAEQIYKLARELKVEITEEIAQGLYVSIITDTGNFRYSNTLPSTFQTVCGLVGSGVIPWQIASYVYDNRSIPSMKVLAYALEKIKTAKNGRLIWSTVPLSAIKKKKAKHDDLISVIDYLRSVKGIEIAVFIREEEKNKIKVNFRSRGRANVSKIARELGGGGHIQASGATLKMPIAKAEKKIISTVLKYL